MLKTTNILINKNAKEMKTKILVLALALMVSGTVNYAQTMEVNTEKSSIEWLGKKIGGQHDGLIQLKNGSLELDGEQITAGKFVVDMTSITNMDIKDEGRNQRLVGHLKSDDFFGVESYPTASFNVVQASKFENDKATLTGDITIKGKKERISFDVVKAGVTFTAEVEIDRSKFDVRYGSKSFFNDLGDNAIDDIFLLRIKLVVN
jgi:polyisoprenoid-binding protein YceI